MSDTSLDLTCALGGRDVVVLDFDGVIADTEPLHAKAYQSVLARWYGVSLSSRQFAVNYMGSPEDQILSRLERDYGVAIDATAFAKERQSTFLGLVEKARLKIAPFVEQLVKQSAIGKVRLFVLSSQNAEILRSLLSRWSLDGEIEEVFSCPSLGLTKAEVLSALEGLVNAPLASVVLFEDSAEIMEMVRGTDIRVVGVGPWPESKLRASCRSPRLDQCLVRDKPAAILRG